MATRGTEYEEVFQVWLDDNLLRHIAVDQCKRKIFARGNIKSFDFLVYPNPAGSDVNLVMAEVKGRKFTGTSLAGKKNFQSWVTMDDVRGLVSWQEIFACDQNSHCRAAFVFVYKFEQVDVEDDGQDVYRYGDNNYLIYAVELTEYQDRMKVRSPKWQTVCLSAKDFRCVATPAAEFFGCGVS
jgi:hypothetical protein